MVTWSKARIYMPKMFNTLKHPLPISLGLFEKEPPSVKQALGDLNWKKAINVDFQAFMKNHLD